MNSSLRTSALTILVGCLAFAPAIAATPSAYSAEYEVLRNGSALGTATVQVEPAGRELWTMSSRTRGTRGLASLAGVEVTERSRFRWSTDVLEAVEYDYSQRAAGRTRERSVRVDADAGTVLTTDRGDRASNAYESGVIDRQILPLAIARDLEQGRAGTLDYRVAERGGVSDHSYRVAGRETIDTPSGRVDAVRVERQRADNDRVTTLWLDPARGHIPVRVLQDEGRDRIETRLVTLSR